MKKRSTYAYSMNLLLTVLLLIYSLNTFAQPPQAISYQAVARNNAGILIVNQLVSLRFTIRNITSGGPVVYREAQTVTTNSIGLFSVGIGQGIVFIGTFATIDWGSGSKFLQVEMDVTGGSTYTNMGTQQMLSVPYAINAGNGNWTKTGNNVYNSNSGNVGIGTSIPSASLEVNGQVKITGGTPGLGKVLTSDANGLSVWQAPIPTVAMKVCIALNGLYPSFGGSTTLPDTYVGEIKIFPYTLIPSGWAECNGQLLNINTNNELFSLIGTTYGGNGTTNFALPNLTGKVIVGQ